MKLRSKKMRENTCEDSDNNRSVITLDNMPGGYHRCSIDEGFPFLYVSDRFLKILGWTRDEIREKFDNKFLNIVYKDDYEKALYFADKMLSDETKNKEKYHEKIYRLVGKNGIKWVIDSTMLVKIGNESFYQGSIADITDFVEHEERQQEQLILATKRAEEANNAKSNFLFSMSHDIRTPLNAIIGFTELMEKYGDDPAKRKNYIEKLKLSNQYLLSLVNNVLEMARIESGNVKLMESEYDIGKLNDSLFWAFEPEMKKKNIKFTREINIKHPYIVSDSTKEREIFQNILSNAVKYTNENGNVHMPLVEIPSDESGYALYQTTIADDGIGISEKFLPTLFDEFTRERNSTESRIEGTGIGMAITKRFVELFDGRIEVESKVGVGTKFTVTLPHKITDGRIVENNSNLSDNINTNRFSGKKILLAEYNEFNKEIAVELLREEGFVIDAVSDGAEALDKIQKSSPNYYDLVLMDIQMPNLNGYEATRQIRLLEDENKAKIPVIAMTANAFDEDKKIALEAGMDEHISKPIEVEKLNEVLSRILDS